MFGRILTAVLVVLVAAVLLVVFWPQLFGVQTLPFVAQLVSFRGILVAAVALLLVLLLAVAVASRRSRRLIAPLAVVLLLFDLGSTAVLLSRGFSSTPVTAQADGGITVMEWNTLGAAPGAAVIARVAVQAGADVVTLPETREQTADQVADAMTQAGHPMAVHTVAVDQSVSARSTSVLIARRLGGYTADASAGSTSGVPSAVLRPDDGSGPTIVAVHAVAPVPNEMRNWRSDLDWLRGACRGDDVILSGDFNSTLDHYAGLASEPGATIGRCTDAAQQAHAAALGTWPTDLPPLLGAPSTM